MAGCEQGALEPPDVDVEQGRVEPVPVGGQGDEHGFVLAGCGAQHFAELAHGDVALRGAVAGRCPRPERLADLVAGRAVGMDGEEGQQLACLAQPAGDLASGDGDLRQPEERDADGSAAAQWLRAEVVLRAGQLGRRRGILVRLGGCRIPGVCYALAIRPGR